MPVDDFGDLDQYLEILRSGEETERNQAWLRVREALRSDPVTVAARVSAIVADLLQQGNAAELVSSILLVLWACTRAVPGAIPGEVPRCVLMRPDGVDPVSVTAAAAMLARQGTDGLVANGLSIVLQVSDAVLEAPQASEKARPILEQMVRELWSNVAIRDPTLLVDILAGWVGRAGAYTPLVALCGELLAKAAPQHPGLADNVLEIVGTISAPDVLISTLENVRFVERLVASLNSADFRGRSVAKSPSLPTPADAGIDRILELFCDPDPERAEAGWQRLVEAPASVALLQGLGEVLIQLMEQRPQDRRIGLGLYIIHSRAAEQPDAVPAAEIDQLFDRGTLSEHDQTFALSTLAMSRPELLVDRHLKSAILLSMKGVPLAQELWQALGGAFPGLLSQVSHAVFSEGGFSSTLGGVLAAAFEPVARARPDQLDDLLGVLRQETVQHPEPELGPGMIRIALTPSVNDLIKRLEQGRQGAPS